MTLALTIKPMTEEDLPAVVAIEQASFSDPWYLQSFRSELLYNRKAIYLTARHRDNIIAYIGAWVVVDEGHITTLAVDKEYRRLGVASRLLETLIEKVLPLGVRRLTLEVRPSNNEAFGFYEKWGFTVQGRRKSYYYDEDALIMTKEGLSLPGGEEEGGAAGEI